MVSHLSARSVSAVANDRVTWTKTDLAVKVAIVPWSRQQLSEGIIISRGLEKTGVMGKLECILSK